MTSSTKTRVFGFDVPFLEWIRDLEELDSRKAAIGVTDVDCLIHHFAYEVIDAPGRMKGKTRQIQALMGLEVKTRNKQPEADFSQFDTLWKWHLTVKKEHREKGTDWIIRNFGWSFLRLSGTRPDNSEAIHWGRFEEGCVLKWRQINIRILIELLGFIRHPDNLSKEPFRRHHASKTIWRIAEQPLGFAVPILEINRS